MRVSLQKSRQHGLTFGEAWEEALRRHPAPKDWRLSHQLPGDEQVIAYTRRVMRDGYERRIPAASPTFHEATCWRDRGAGEGR